MKTENSLMKDECVTSNGMTLVSFQQVCINEVGENLLISEYEEPWTDRVSYASRRVKLEA